MSWQRSIQSAIRALRKDEDALRREIQAVQARIKDLEQLGRAEGPSNARARRAINKNRLSTEGRDAISRAAKKRWAKYRAEQRKSAK